MACENKVIQYLQKKKLKLLKHRYKISGIEVDLIFMDSSGDIHVVEVKSCSEYLDSQTISKKQCLRINSACEALRITTQRAVRAHLALVNAKNQILVHKDFLVDLGFF